LKRIKRKQDTAVSKHLDWNKINSAMKLKVHLHSNIGKSPPGNQDNFLLLNLNDNASVKGDSEDFSTSKEIDEVGTGVLMMVADGVGGRVGGKMASLLAVESMAERFLEKNPEKTGEDTGNLLLKQLVEAARKADRKIYEKSRADAEYFGIAAGLTGAVIKDSKLHLLHLGQNRLYLIRNRKIYQITKDQSYLHYIVDSGYADEYSATHHFIRMEYWYYLGEKEGVYIQAAQCGILNLQKDDILLFSTHGLFEYRFSPRIDYALTEAEILKTVLENRDDLSETASKLLETLYSKKDLWDSVVMVLAEVQGDELPPDLDQEPVIEPVSIETLENVCP
jgi:serine/threonine protein phosphatase PrpC